MTRILPILHTTNTINNIMEIIFSGKNNNLFSWNYYIINISSDKHSYPGGTLIRRIEKINKENSFLMDHVKEVKLTYD